MRHRDFVDHATEQWKVIRPDADPAPLEVVLRMTRASSLVNNRLDQAVRRAGLRVKGDYQAIAALRRNMPNPLSATDLAGEIMVSTSGLTGRLDRLEASDLIRRVQDPADRRAILVELTEQGVNLVDSLYDTSVAIQDEIVGTLTKVESDTLSATLRKLLLALGDRAP